MKGAIIGDVVGSVHEHAGTKTTRFPLLPAQARFTDDTVLTIAVAECLLEDGDPAAALRRWGRRYPLAGYGGMFAQWLVHPDAGPYGSWGNGGPMRVSPCGYFATTSDEAITLATRVTGVTHNHPEAIRGAGAVATAIFLARQGLPASALRTELANRFEYDLTLSIDELRPEYRFDVSSVGTVPPALLAAFEARSVEEAVRLAISLGGDADTLACIAGSVAEPLYGLDEAIWEVVAQRLPPEMLAVIEQFDAHIAKSGDSPRW